MGKTIRKSVLPSLIEALAIINRPGAFCATGTAAATLPGLEVDELGAIGLPLTIKQAKELKKHCQQAPYGKGKETLVDTKVRRVWRMSTEKFALTNPAWKALLKEVIAQVQADLGLEEQKLEAHLYELLLYEPGSFFLSHRDGEKLDRMVATLVIVLPSSYEGGELVVRHEGEEQTVDFSGENRRYQTHFAAFYADCEHEVKPLRSGYRLCLVYNLTVAKSKKPLGAPRRLEHIERVKDVLRNWSTDPGAPRKLAVTLEHQYSQEGLAWDALKGVDRAKALSLAEAGRQSGCQVHLALLTLWESGAADYSDYTPRRWGRHSWRQDDDGGPYEMSEVYDTSLTAEHWRSPDGDRPRFGAIPVEREEVVPQDSLTAIEPEEDFEGYTGNAGMTLERWYRHAAVVLWPDERHLDILCEVGSRRAVPALARMVSSWRKAEGDEAATQKARCVEFAGKILAQWEANPFRGWRDSDDDDAHDVMPLLARLGDVELIRTYLRDVLVKDASLEPGKATAKVVVDHGWTTFRSDLVVLFGATDSETIERNVRLLEQLCLASAHRGRQKRNESEGHDMCRVLGESTVAALIKIDAQKDSSDWRLSRIERATLLARLARAMLAGDLDALLSRVVAHVLSSPKRYPVRTVHVPALARLASWLTENLKHASPALSKWIAACDEQLDSMTAAAPQPPADFRRDADLKCDCRDCADLKRFLRDPRERERAFQMPQHRRGHLESNIREYTCDLNCTTNKRPRPQILVCTKNTASYERRLKEHQENLEHLTTLRSLEKNLPA